MKAHQAPPSMGFSRQGYWSGLPFPSPGDLPDPGIEPGSPTLQADALPSEPPGNPISSKSLLNIYCIFSILVSGYLSVTPFCFQDFGSFSLSLFRILCQVESLSLPLLFGLVGIYPVPLPSGYSSVSSSSLYCCGLSVFWQFVEFSLLWRFLAVCGFVQVACQGFLVREACVGVLVGGPGFLLSGVQ